MSLEPSKLALPFMANLELGRQSLFVWSDPFRPTMEEEMRAWAQRWWRRTKAVPTDWLFSDMNCWWYSALFTYI